MNQKGIVGTVVTILILILGIGITVYLTQFTQVFKPKASESNTIPAQTLPSLKSITINTMQFDTRIPADTSLPVTDYQSGWEKSEFVPFMKEKIDAARKIGFNTVWLVFPWQRRIPNDSLLNTPALNNLKEILTYAQDKNMKVILPLNYCSAGWCWGAPGSSYLLSTDPSLWQKYQDYTKALVSALNSYPNVNYLLFSENMVPQVSVLRNSSYPQYKTSFSNFWQTQNGNLSFLNSRWGTNFNNWTDVLPPPDNLAGANEYYIQDYYQWSGNVIENTLSKLAPELQALKNPESKIGYHDYLWQKSSILGNEDGIPTQNPYDFLSVGNYPDWNNPQNYLQEPDKFITFLDSYKNSHPNTPIFIGELGADSNTYPPENGQYVKQSYFINQILEKAKSKIFGFNIWQLIDYQDPLNLSEGKFGFIKTDNSYKQPTVDNLRNNSLRPIINSSGVSTAWNPWAVWIKGNNLNPDLIYVVRDNNAIWLDYQKIQFNKQEDTGTFQLPQNTPPSRCNTDAACSLQLVLWNPYADLTSNPVNFSLPAVKDVVSPPPSQNPNASPSKPGDADGNGTVDIFDFNLVVSNFGRTGTGIRGDLDNNNKVDIFDYNLLVTNFGR